MSIRAFFYFSVSGFCETGVCGSVLILVKFFEDDLTVFVAYKVYFTGLSVDDFAKETAPNVVFFFNKGVFAIYCIYLELLATELGR
jgi:hypothetical protein